MKNIFLSIAFLVVLGFGLSVEFPPSLYDKANQEAIRLTGCGISDIKKCTETPYGYEILAVSECGKEDFIIVIEN